MVTWSIFNIKMLELYRIDNIKRSAISLKHAWILRERLITTAQKPNQYVSFLKKHCCSLSGSAWWETLLIPVARNYKRVLSCSLFRSNRAARDYRCESQITVLAVLSWVTVLYPQRYWRKKMPWLRYYPYRYRCTQRHCKWSSTCPVTKSVQCQTNSPRTIKSTQYS